MARGDWKWKGMSSSYKPRDFFEMRILLVLMRQFRTPQSTAKRPFLRQEWLA